MKRVLIVDDEYLVRLGLKSTINWNAYGYQIVGEASGGREALALFDELEPDIVMTDIKMSGMDGLELLAEIKKRRPHKEVKMVILSNYDNFAFAREAMKLGAVRYLLKSEINEAGLIETLRSLSVEDDDKPPLPDDASSARLQYLQRQLYGIPANAPVDAAKLAPPPHGLFGNPPYVAIKCSCTIERGAEQPENGGAPAQTLQSIVGFSLDFPDSVTCTGSYKEVEYLTYVGSAKGLTTKRLEELCKLIVRNVKNYIGAEMRVGVSETGDAAALPLLLSQAEQARGRGFFSGKSVTFYEEAAPADEEHIHVSHSKLRRIVLAGEREALMEYIAELFARIEATCDYKVMQRAFVDLVSIAKSVCEEASIGLITGLSQDKFDYDVLAKIHSLTTARCYIDEIYDNILTALGRQKHYYSHTIKKCLSFIEQSYSEPITLEDAARAVDISPSYLSMTFKQEMGISFVNHLTRRRISHSEELLVGTGMKIYEIAERVGFSSPYYFSRVFKEQTGLSCKEYRDRHTEES